MVLPIISMISKYWFKDAYMKLFKTYTWHLSHPSKEYKNHSSIGINEVTLGTI